YAGYGLRRDSGEKRSITAHHLERGKIRFASFSRPMYRHDTRSAHEPSSFRTATVITMCGKSSLDIVDRSGHTGQTRAFSPAIRSRDAALRKTGQCESAWIVWRPIHTSVKCGLIIFRRRSPHFRNLTVRMARGDRQLTRKLDS